jgi:hypothetical protein
MNDYLPLRPIADKHRWREADAARRLVHEGVRLTKRNTRHFYMASDLRRIENILSTSMPRRLVPPMAYQPQENVELDGVHYYLGTFVYFIRCGEFIKIGFAVDVRQRLKDLQRASPFQLELLRVTRGGPAEEARWHDQFSHIRRRGEWFDAAPDLMEAIESLTSDTWFDARSPEKVPRDGDGRSAVVPFRKRISKGC